MRITRVYTRTGDKGTTHLVGGSEVSKDDIRIESYGTVDELNAVIGLVRTFLANEAFSDVDRARMDAPLAEIQNDLFDLGADLATPAADRWPTMQRLGPGDATRMENWIDSFNDELPPLKEFVLPGGGVVGSFLHQARTVCRRAERIVVTLRLHADDVGDGGLIYLNRLSDLLFVLGRWAAKAGNVPEVLWTKRTPS